MGQHGQGPSLSSEDLSKKRKRGRPRKDENLVQENNTPAAPAKSVGLMNNGHSGMLGQVVAGYIDGIFNEGYLITVKIGGMYLRGLAFLPGRVAPITAENDVAPHAKMIRRHEIPVPVLDSQAKHHSSTLPSEKYKEQPGIPAPISLNQVTATQPLSAVPIAGEHQSAPTSLNFMGNSQKNDTSSSLDRKVVSEQTPGSGINNQPVAASQLKPDKVVQQDKTTYDFGASNLMKGLNVSPVPINDSKKLIGPDLFGEHTLESGFGGQSASIESQLKHGKLDLQTKVMPNAVTPAPNEGFDISLGPKGGLELGTPEPNCADFLGKFSERKSPVQDNVASADLKPDQLIQGLGKPDIQLNKSHVEMEEASDLSSKNINSSREMQAPFKDIPEAKTSKSGLDVFGNDTSFLGNKQQNDVHNLSQPVLNPTYMETTPPEPKLTTEGSTFPVMDGKHLNDNASKSNQVAEISDMNIISSEQRLADEVSSLSNVIDSSIGGLSNASKNTNGDN